MADKSEMIFELLEALREGRISMASYRAQMRDLKCSEDEIDLYLDGDWVDPE